MRVFSLSFATLLLLAFSITTHASSTLRVGSQVLVAGDSAMRVLELLGKPSRKSHQRIHRSSRGGRRARGVRVGNDTAGGERWQYRRGDHVTTITMVDDRVSDIQDSRF